MKLGRVGVITVLVALACSNPIEEQQRQAEAETRKIAAAENEKQRDLDEIRRLGHADEAAAPALPEAAAPAVTSGPWEGEVDRKAGAAVTVKGAGAPPKGAKGTLSKKIDQKLGGMTISAWLVIADVVVESSAGDAATLTIVQEQSVTVVNGEKVDHFKAGSHVKFEPAP